MKKFKQFIKENLEPIKQGELGKLSIEDDGLDYEETWKYTLILKKTWKQYNEKKITLLDFNNIYASTLIENQQQISAAVGDAAWNSLEPIIVDDLRKATTIEDSEKVYDKLYDVYDKYEIFIDTGDEQNDVFENSMEQQEFSVGDIVKVMFSGEERTARISKIATKNTYLIQIEDNTHFLPKEHSIYKSDIIDVISTNESPATVSDWNQPLKQRPSNDLVVNGNGSPGVPAPGMPFN